MGKRWIAAALLLGVSQPALADERRSSGLADCTLPCLRDRMDNKPQLQADLGLAVVGAAYEHPLADRVSLKIEAQIFGTYFLPWFSLGSNVKGVGGQLQPTWFANTDGHGVYVAPFLRVDRVADDTSTGVGFCVGAVAGWAFRLTPKLDLRTGGGVQYMRYRSGTIDIATPFVSLDLVVGYRL